VSVFKEIKPERVILQLFDFISPKNPSPSRKSLFLDYTGIVSLFSLLFFQSQARLKTYFEKILG